MKFIEAIVATLAVNAAVTAGGAINTFNEKPVGQHYYTCGRTSGASCTAAECAQYDPSKPPNIQPTEYKVYNCRKSIKAICQCDKYNNQPWP
ncbi:hypothetical protein BDR26DRAFT_857449 [Obelidium mucronatum]|nr:hypothetical protein BDR26DRAFT_857449 [Obelidium mucronatum]